LQNTKGRLSQILSANSLAGSIYSYDSMGRVTNEWQCTPINCGTGAFALQYGYDYLGDMTSFLNSLEGVTYTYSYDTAARLSQFKSSLVDTTHPGTLLTVNQYNPLGELQQATLGNGIVRNIGYDNRGRLTSRTDGSIYTFTLGYTPDSNILTGNDSINGNWTYSYDDFSRLSTSSKTSQAFNYKYDRFGNRWQQNLTAGSGPSPSFMFDANNHIVGSSYDAAGNLLNDGSGHSFTYDAEGRVTAATGSSYVYDAFSRVARRSFGTYTMDFILNREGKPVTEVNGASWARSELYATGIHTATYVSGATYFFHLDWLGSVKVETKYDGTVSGTMSNLGFGDGQVWTGTLPSWSNFAGGDYDNGTGLDLFMFRQYSTTQGRWIMPDPAGQAAVEPGNPQSWNRYAYVGNNPLRLVDPFGLDCSDGTSGGPDTGPVDCPDIPDNSGPTFQSTSWAPVDDGDVDGEDDGGGIFGILAVGVFHPETPAFRIRRAGKTNGAKQIGVCLVKGAAIGAASALAVGALAAGAVAVGAPVAAVTGVLGVLAVAGGAALGYDVIGQIKSSNWAGLAYDAGSVLGGAAVGVAGGGRAIAEGVNGVPSPPWSLRSDLSQGYKRDLGSPGQWLGTGPNPGSAGGSAAAAGAGVARVVKSGC
jgi:RHS repeat-associated protein